MQLCLCSLSRIRHCGAYVTAGVQQRRAAVCISLSESRRCWCAQSGVRTRDALLLWELVQACEAQLAQLWEGVWLAPGGGQGAVQGGGGQTPAT